MKTYLVTGGAGFIGSNFINYLLKANNDLKVINVDKLTYAGNLENLNAIKDDSRYTFVQADICSRSMISKLFRKNKIDYVVNFAAESHVDRSISNPTIFAKTNVEGTLNLLNCAKAAWQIENEFLQGVKFLQVSTDEVYGALGPTGFFTETTPLDPHSPYSASKTSADLFVKSFYDTFKFPINITRCSNNYGPFQFPEKLIPLIINNAINHKQLPIYGDGLQIRDWLYVLDHCRAIAMVLDKGKVGEVYNIGGHNERTNLSIVKTIISYLHENYDKSIDESLIYHVEDRKGHDRRYGIAPDKIKSEVGWEPSIFFEEGIKETIKWYLENNQWMKNVTSGSYLKYYKKMYKGC